MHGGASRRLHRLPHPRTSASCSCRASCPKNDGSALLPGPVPTAAALVEPLGVPSAGLEAAADASRASASRTAVPRYCGWYRTMRRLPSAD
jgi:hypothetical protein